MKEVRKSRKEKEKEGGEEMKNSEGEEEQRVPQQEAPWRRE